MTPPRPVPSTWWAKTNLNVAVLSSSVFSSHAYCASPSVISHMSLRLEPPPKALSTATGECQYGSMTTNRASPQVQA